jgi:hypothetical protein
MLSNTKPTTLEFALYYQQFVDLVDPEVKIDLQLKAQAQQVALFYKALNTTQLNEPLAQGKWTPKQVLQHLIDYERVFQYRAFMYSRAFKEPIGFIDEADFIKQSIAQKLSLTKLLSEYKAVRQASVMLFKNQSKATLTRIGLATNANMSVRACFWVIVGHERHHLNQLLLTS